MPPKSVTCLVCHAAVLKSQTVAFKDGRACRSHGEALAELEERKAAERERLDAEIRAASRPKFRSDPIPTSDELRKWRERTETHCWICDREGSKLQEIMTDRLIAMKRLEIRGELNFLTMVEDISKLTGERLALLALELRDEAIDKAIVKHVRDRRLRDILHFIRHVLFCIECAKKHGFAKRWDERIEKAQPTFEQVVAFMPVMEMVEPVLRELAEEKERQN